jgi:hypothetical protein
MSARAYVRLVPTIWVCQACKDTSRIIIRVDQDDFAGKGEISPLYTPKREKDLQIERVSDMQESTARNYICYDTVRSFQKSSADLL